MNYTKEQIKQILQKELFNKKYNFDYNKKQPANCKTIFDLFLYFKNKYPNFFKNGGEILYCYKNKNNIEKLINEMFCKCGKKVNFNNFLYGYRKYCSKKCANSDSLKIQKMKNTCYITKDIDGLNIYQKGAILGHKNRLNNIDKDGLNGEQRAIIHQKETKFIKYGDPNYNNSKKANKTKLLNIDENGLNSFQRTALKAKITNSQIDQSGLNGYQKNVINKRNNIDENGLNSYQRGSMKAKQTALNNIDENGLNSFQRRSIKALKTNKNNHNGKHNWASKDPKLNGKATRKEKYGDENYSNPQKAKQTRLNTIDKNGLNINQRIALKNKQHYITNYGVENYKQIHITNYNNINEQFFRDNFIIDGRFDIDKCCKYFNVGKNWVYLRKQIFNILEPVKQTQEILQNTIYDFIKNICKVDITSNNRKVISPLELDIYIPEKKLAIEFNGIYWHSINKGINKNYHQNKSKLCYQKGIRLIHIYEDEWDDKNKREIIKDIIKHALNIPILENKIYARKCIIKEIENKQYNDFCNKYHIQGTKGAQVKLGLFYNNELVQIASFSKSRYDKQYEWEWIRGCPASNNNVIGGTSKLFKYFIRKYNPKSVICYADFNKFDGKGYKECGFKFDKITAPDKFYFDIKNNIRVNRNPKKYKEYKEKVKNNEFLLLYGSGNLKFTWQNYII